MLYLFEIQCIGQFLKQKHIYRQYATIFLKNPSLWRNFGNPKFSLTLAPSTIIMQRKNFLILQKKLTHLHSPSTYINSWVWIILKFLEWHYFCIINQMWKYLPKYACAHFPLQCFFKFPFRVLLFKYACNWLQ